MLGKQAIHDRVAVGLGSRIVALPPVELGDHPFWEWTVMGLDRRQLLELVRVGRHVARKGVDELGGDMAAALKALCRETKGRCLEPGVHHPLRIARATRSGTPIAVAIWTSSRDFPVEER
jgi:hypothetical protein